MSKNVARLDKFGRSPKSNLSEFETPHMLRRVARQTEVPKDESVHRRVGSNTICCELYKKKPRATWKQL
jgi:hypothetical protein